MGSPVSDIRFIHKAISRELTALEEAAAELGVDDDEAVAEFADRLEFLRGVVKAHAAGEEADMYPALEERAYPISDSYLLDHEIEQSISAELSELIERYRKGDAAEREAAVKRIRRQAVALNVTLSAHIRKEEELLVPLFDKHFSYEEQGPMIGRAMSYYSEEQLRTGIPWVIEALTPQERAEYLKGLYHGVPPERFRQVAGWIEDGVAAETWSELVREVPELSAA